MAPMEPCRDRPCKFGLDTKIVSPGLSFGAGEETADHHRSRAGRQCFCDIAGILMPPSAMIGTL